MDRVIENILVEDCGCYTQRITESWMSEIVTYDNVIICAEHW